MIRRLNEQRAVSRFPNVDFRVLVEPEEMYDAGRLYAHITIAPGASIAFHKHEDEMESFYVLRGPCRVEDNAHTEQLEAGDMLITGDGESHAVYNDGKEPIELIASIISSKQGIAGKSVMNS